MAILFLAIFVAVPIIEIALFIQVGGAIGLWPTLGIVILTAIVGTWLLRLQGLAVLTKIRTQLDRGQVPAAELFDGACLLVAGVLLLTPGFATDACGLLLFVPPVRNALRHWLSRIVQVRHGVWTGPGAGPGTGPGPGAGPGTRRGPGTIDGDAVEVPDSPPSSPRDDDMPTRRIDS